MRRSLWLVMVVALLAFCAPVVVSSCGKKADKGESKPPASSSAKGGASAKGVNAVAD